MKNKKFKNKNINTRELNKIAGGTQPDIGKRTLQSKPIRGIAASKESANLAIRETIDSGVAKITGMINNQRHKR